MSCAVSTTDLCKTYGAHQVLKNLNLRVPKGSVYGFVGANGAGKTTTIRILLGLAGATSGVADVLGTQRGSLPPAPIEGVSYLPDVPEVSPWLGAKDALISLARLDGVAPDVAAMRANDLLELVGLKSAPGKAGEFSRGMKQRLGIAAALVTAPQLVVMDEPTSALDPMGRADVLAVINELAGQATVMFSSHILSDVQKVSTHIGILHRGQLLAQGSVEELLAGVRGDRAYLDVSVRADLIDQLIEATHAIDPNVKVTKRNEGLEQLFVHLTRNGEML